jgi:pantoate--beta-alanine ligase
VKVVRTTQELRLVLREARRGLVPTMGAFHEGHRSLMRAARVECEQVVVSLFVNPAQFADRDDLASYPRDEQQDVRFAQDEGVDVLFMPSAQVMYPDGFATWIDVDASGGEADARPGHFRGVATVCVKLFNLVQPDFAYFGQKDAQQASVLRRVVRDLNVPVQLRILPTVRDEDGLALSSRNVHLTPAERKQALALPRALESARSADDPVAAARAALNGLEPEYVELLQVGDATLLTAAARVGATRLIDNVVVEGALG